MKATDELSTRVSTDGYNKTQLNVAQDMERHVFHRDRLAHFFRWAHVMRAMKQNYRIVDLGCGSGALATMLYANRFSPELYVGVDIRGKTLESTAGYFAGRNFSAVFLAADLCKDGWVLPVLNKFHPENDDNGVRYFPHVVTSFEFVEHIPREQVVPFLQRVKNIMGPDTAFYLSTPCYDGVRKAENHVYEWRYQELKDELEKIFVVEDHWGTFISQKDFEAEVLGPSNKNNPAAELLWGTWERLKQYYGAESLAILFAPLFPAIARNCIWKLRLPQ